MSLRNVLTAMFMALFSLAARGAEAPDSIDESASIMGSAFVPVDKMFYFISAENPDFQYEIAQAFYSIGERYGIRGDIALCQAILETGWFKYEGSVITPEMHNYGGLGVTGPGAAGCSYETIDDGVTAFMQHLFAYACTDDLPDGETKIDSRFDLVKRGCAPSWSGLTMKWAMNRRYASDIIDIYRCMRAFE